MDADGSNLTRLTETDSDENFGPSWSPDGSTIAFCNFTGDFNSGKFEISMNVMNADGSNLIRFIDSDCWPAWSPVSSKMAFTSRRDGNVEIYAMDADGANVTRLTDNPADDVGPQWSPDGSKIVFSSGTTTTNPRSLAGKPLAGFRATPDRRIIVLCGMIVSVIWFKNPLLHRQSSLRKRRLGENRGFRQSF